VFQPYTEDDMVAIIIKRLGKGRALIEEAAIKFAAKKVSKTSGDVRLVLDIVKLAFTKCLSDLAPELLNQTIDGKILVTLRHVMLALKDSGALPLANIISHLPQSCKSVLCIAVGLQSCIPPQSVLTLGMLKKYCAQASMHHIMTLENASNESYIDIVRQLEDAGLLSIGGSSDIFFHEMSYDPSGMQLSIQCGMDDVECAMGEALFNQPFYRNMFDFIRKNMS
jgi:Cdc6-like AAA superfamily ATPase